MAGKPSNLGASSCTSTKQDEKRKQDITRGKKAKKQRPSQPNVMGHPKGAAVPDVPLHSAASNTMAMAFLMAGVNGAALRWSTAATLGAAGRAVALSLPVMANANGPSTPFALALAPGLQVHPGSAIDVAASSPPMAVVHGVTAPLVLARAAGQPVPVPLKFIGHEPMASTNGVPASSSAVGLPLASALAKFEPGTLGRMLSALMPACRPPLRHHQSKTGTPPPWWPTASELWWMPEVVAHLGKKALMNTPVPFTAGYNLKKAEKVAVLVAIVKHLTPDFARISAAVNRSNLSEYEAHLWNNAIVNELVKFILQQQQQPPPPRGDGDGDGDGHRLDPSNTTNTEGVVHGSITASDGCEQVVNIHGAAVPAPANNGVQVVVAASEQEHDGGGIVHGGTVSADAPGDDGREQPVNFAGDGGVPLGATVTEPSEDIYQLPAELELQLEQHGDMYVFEAEQEPDDMLAPLQMPQDEGVQQIADVEAFGAATVAEMPEDHPWYDKESSPIFGNVDMPGTPHSFDDGWFYY